MVAAVAVVASGEGARSSCLTSPDVMTELRCRFHDNKKERERKDVFVLLLTGVWQDLIEIPLGTMFQVGCRRQEPQGHD